MKLLITLLALFLLCISQTQAKTLYIFPKIENINIADKSIDLIQCIFQKSDYLVDVLQEKQERYPLLELTENKNKMEATLILSKTQKASLGSSEIDQFTNHFCVTSLNFLESQNTTNKDSNQLLQNTSFKVTKRKNFFERNWPYFAVAGALTAGFIIYKNSQKEEKTKSYTSSGIQFDY